MSGVLDASRSARVLARIAHEILERNSAVTRLQILPQPPAWPRSVYQSKSKLPEASIREIERDRFNHDAKGWYGLMEEMCVPLDEVDQFNARIRNPAGGVIQ